MFRNKTERGGETFYFHYTATKSIEIVLITILSYTKILMSSIKEMNSEENT